MTRAYDREYFLTSIGVPEHLLASVTGAPRLLSGERQEDFFLFFEAMAKELLPNSDLEWLVAIDLAWIYLEIQRYRRWKNSLIAIEQRAALEHALLRSDPATPISGPTLMARGKVRMTVAALEGGASNDRDVVAQLAQHGYDDDALNATAFMQAAVPLAVVEKFLATARQQLTTTLREVAVRREFKLRAEHLERRLEDQDRRDEASRQDKPDQPE